MTRVNLKGLQVALHSRLILILPVEHNALVIPEITVHIYEIARRLLRFSRHGHIVVASDSTCVGSFVIALVV